MFGAISGLMGGKGGLGALGGIFGGGGKRCNPQNKMARQFAQQMMGLPKDQQQAQLQQIAQQNPALAQKVAQKIEKYEMAQGGGCNPMCGCGGRPQVAGLNPMSVINASSSIMPQVGYC